MKKSIRRAESTYVYRRINGKEVLTNVIGQTRDAMNHLLFYMGRYSHVKQGSTYREDKTKVMMIEVHGRGFTYREAVRNWIAENPLNENVIDAIAGLLWMSITPLDVSTYLLVGSPAKKVTRYSLTMQRENKLYDFQEEKKRLISDFYPSLIRKIEEYAIEKETSST